MTTLLLLKGKKTTLVQGVGHMCRVGRLVDEGGECLPHPIQSTCCL